LNINNFSDNRLFNTFALEDIAELFDIKIVVFNDEIKENNENNIFENEEPLACKTYKPVNSKSNDHIFLSYNKDDKIKYKWLMPNATSCTIKKYLLNTLKQDSYFLKTSSKYSHQYILIDSQLLFQRFGECQNKNNRLNLLLFVNFLTECPVHTLTSLKELNLDDILLSSKDPNDMINHLVGFLLTKLVDF